MLRHCFSLRSPYAIRYAAVERCYAFSMLHEDDMLFTLTIRHLRARATLMRLPALRVISGAVTLAMPRSALLMPFCLCLRRHYYY